MKFEKLRQIQYCNLPVPKYTIVGENYESLKLRSFTSVLSKFSRGTELCTSFQIYIKNDLCNNLILY